MRRYGRRDGHVEANIRFSQCYERAPPKKPSLFRKATVSMKGIMLHNISAQMTKYSKSGILFKRQAGDYKQYHSTGRTSEGDIDTCCVALIAHNLKEHCIKSLAQFQSQAYLIISAAGSLTYHALTNPCEVHRAGFNWYLWNGIVPVYRHVHSAYKYPKRQLLRKEPLRVSTNYVKKKTPHQKTTSVDAKKVMLRLNNKDVPDTET